jgi:hypothetical protein
MRHTVAHEVRQLTVYGCKTDIILSAQCGPAHCVRMFFNLKYSNFFVVRIHEGSEGFATFLFPNGVLKHTSACKNKVK